jgi:hypothetical protein
VTVQDPWSASKIDSGAVRDPSTPPAVVFWYKVTMALSAVMYGLLAIGCFAGFAAADSIADQETSSFEVRMMSGFMLAICVPFAIAYVVPFFLKPTKAAWIYAMVLMGILATSCCFWPMVIPLFIYWVRDETKQYFAA